MNAEVQKAKKKKKKKKLVKLVGMTVKMAFNKISRN